MTELPEEKQLSALRTVMDAAQRRADAEAMLSEATNGLRDAVTGAVSAGAPRGRVRELAHISASTMYAWLDAAGIEVRPKRRARKGEE